MEHLDRCEATGKVCYTYAEANKKAQHARRSKRAEDRGAPCSAFHCPRCGWCHWGHRGESESRRKRRLTR